MSDKRVLTISAIVLVAVIMGMSSVAPVIAPGPPGEPPAGVPGPPDKTQVCLDIENSEDIPEALKAILLAALRC